MSLKVLQKTGRRELIKMQVSEELYFDVYTEVREIAVAEDKNFPLIPLEMAVLNTGYGVVELSVMRKQ